jgi:hypothetical protein
MKDSFIYPLGDNVAFYTQTMIDSIFSHHHASLNMILYSVHQHTSRSKRFEQSSKVFLGIAGLGRFVSISNGSRTPCVHTFFHDLSQQVMGEKYCVHDDLNLSLHGALELN